MLARAARKAAAGTAVRRLLVRRRVVREYPRLAHQALRVLSQISLACTQNPLFVTSHGGLDMIFRDPTCPYGAVVVAVVVCVDVYYILYNIITTAHTRMIHHHCDMYFQR